MTTKQLILNRYRPMSEAGTGGFATVQVAWDIQMQRKVAIKCIELTRATSGYSPDEMANAASSPSGDGAPAGGSPSKNRSGRAHVEDLRPGSSSAPTRVVRAEDIPPWEDLPEEVPNDADATCVMRPKPEPERDADPFSPAGFGNPKSIDAAGLGDSDNPNDSGNIDAAGVPGLAEARAIAQFNDQNIVTVYNFEVEGSMAYLIMEYVEGVTLEQFLRDHDGDLTLDIVASVFSGVAHALEVAHSRSILHLDIKPANVLINRQGEVKVTDFGLATLADAGGVGAAGGGTIGYMPPEQMRAEPLDARCDEWALASLTYEMLTGSNPFIAKDLPHAEAAIENAELVLPSLLWEDIDEGIDDVMFYALDPDAAERYDTVKDFEEELLPYLGNRREGKKQLALLVNGIDEEGEVEGESDKEPREPHIPLMERISERGLKVAARVAAVLSTALVSLVALANVPHIGFVVGQSGFASPIAWGLLAAFCVAAAVKLHVGALLAFVSLGISLTLNGAYAPGILLAVGAGAWWWFAGREGDACAVSALSAPLFGAVGFAPAAPVLAGGLVVSVVRAVAAAAMAGLASFALGSLSTMSLIDWNAIANWDFSLGSGSVAAGSNAVVDPDQVAGAYLSSTGIGAQTQARLGGMLMKPGNWAVFASWLGAAAVMSALSKWGMSRKVDVLAACLGAAILLAGVLAAAWFASPGAWTPPTFGAVLGAAVPGIGGIVLAAIGLPDKVRQ